MPIRRILIAAVASLGLLGPLGTGTAAAGLFSGYTIDGPSPDIASVGNVSIARDASGAIVYLKRVGGVPHVFASVLSAGRAWGSPQQLDSGLPGPVSQAAIAAASKGRVAAVFISGGGLFASVQNPGQSGFSPPQGLASGTVNASLSMSTNGTAYVSFTGAGPAGAQDDVYVARLDRAANTFQMIPQPLNLDPTQPAGYDGVTRSQVAAATDGQALVVWGEAGSDGRTHVIARRVSVQGPSPAVQDLTLPSLNGQPGGSADTPTVALKDASDFGWVAFRQTFNVGGVPVSRAIARYERGSTFEDPTVIDPLSFPSADGAAGPQLEIDGSGDGLAAVGLLSSHEVYADPVLDPNSVIDPEWGSPERIDAANNTIAPQPAVAIGGIHNYGGVAWEQSTGPADPPSVHARAFTVAGFQEEGPISASLLGPVDTSGPLAGAADGYGDAFFAYVQGDPANRRVVLGGAANPPGDFDLKSLPAATNQARPVLSWTRSIDLLGIGGYQIDVNGKAVATVNGRSARLPSPLPDGAYRMRVVALDPYGVGTPSSSARRVRIDTHRPRPAVSISGGRRAGSQLRFTVRPRDPSPSSGIASVRVDFGDGASASGARVSHTYGRSGTFTVRVVVHDRAGNVGVARQQIHIA